MKKIHIVKTHKYLMLLTMAVFFYTFSFAQTTEITKLKQQLPAAKDSNAYVALLNKIGFLMHMKSADSCFYYGIKANAIAQRLNYSPGKADALANIAIALTLKGLYSQSLNYYSQALTEYKKDNNQGEVAQMIMNSAITYSFLGDSIKSLQFAKRALAVTRKIGEDSLAATLYANYENLNDKLPPDSVEYYLQKSKTIANKYKDDRSLLFVDQLYADKLIGKGETAAALPFLRHSLQLATNHNWEYHQLESLSLFADYYMAKKNIDSAIVEYNTIYKMASANGFMYWQTDVLKSLLHCYELKNDYAQQARINKLLVSSIEQNNNNNNAFIGDYITYNNTQQQVKELELLNKSKSAKIWLLVALSIVCLAFAGLLYYMYSRSRKGSKTLSALNEKIGLQNEELQVTDEFKSKLISMLAHDFRAPLASTISMIRLLKDDDDDFDKAQLTELYDLIETDIQNILITFDNILQWIKKQLSGYVFNPQELLVHELMNDASSMFKANLDVKKIGFKNEVPDGLTYFSDKEIIQFINRNLIHNALKFSPVGGTITVSAEVKGKELIIAVKDEGTGISESKLKQLFSFNMDQKTESMDKGAGIALTICKEFISKINGRLWAESREKKGTTFFYALPIN